MTRYRPQNHLKETGNLKNTQLKADPVKSYHVNTGCPVDHGKKLGIN